MSGLVTVWLLALLSGCASKQKVEKDWFSAWAMSHNARVTAPAMSGRTVRMILVPSVSGTGVRVKLENTMGKAPVVFSGAYIGVAGTGAAVQEKTITRLTFAGQPGLSLAPGQGAYSDSVPFAVKAFENLSLSLDVQSAGDISTHHLGLRTNWSATGARASDPSGDGFEPLPEIGKGNRGQWPYYWVAALDVRSPETTGTIVLVADSITDGRCSTKGADGIVQPNLNQRWGDVLAARLAARPKQEQKAVAISAIAGNRLLKGGNGPPVLERLERDVLDRAGVTHIVLFIGTNDIHAKFTAAQISAGMQQVMAAAHAKGIKVIGATIIPRGKAEAGERWTSAHETERLALNEWIRSKANFDGLIDFDALMKDGPVVTLGDGGSARAMPPAWDCDGTHPSPAGYKAMGEFVDLQLFAR